MITRLGQVFVKQVTVAILACVMFGGTVSADELRTASDIKGVSLVPLATLPRSPEKRTCDSSCANKLTAVARQVAKLGWIVTSEERLDRYWVVTFASGFAYGTSSIPFPRNANIAIFDGADLVALAYTARKSDWQLGVAEPLESGALLIWSGGEGGAPIGELRAENGGLRFTEISPERTFCHGRAVVPNVYGKSIAAARRILIAHGWRPEHPREKPGKGDVAADLAKQGVIEAESCSGTGMGYCMFRYRNPVGDLNVITVGSEPDPAGNSLDSNFKCNTST